MSMHTYRGMAAGAWAPPAPQLLKDVLMLIVGYRADPAVLHEVLPPGLEPHESGLVQMNMYECPDPAQTSGFGAFSLTYLTVEVAGHDSQTAEGTMSLPGRYWVGYWNSSPRVRTYAREQSGIPALPGECTWTIEGDRLVSRLSVDGETVIEATARVGTEETGVLGGHLNYYAHREIPAPVGGVSAISELLEIPIPFIAHLRDAQVERRVPLPRGIPVRPARPAEPTGGRRRPARPGHVHLLHGPADPGLPRRVSAAVPRRPRRPAADRCGLRAGRRAATGGFWPQTK